MANQSLQGRPIDKANAVDFLDAATTDASGSYKVSYTPRSCCLQANLHLVARVFDNFRRLLYVSSVQKNVAASVFKFPRLVLERKHARGIMTFLRSNFPGLDEKLSSDPRSGTAQLEARLFSSYNTAVGLGVRAKVCISRGHAWLKQAIC